MFNMTLGEIFASKTARQKRGVLPPLLGQLPGTVFPLFSGRRAVWGLKSAHTHRATWGDEGSGLLSPGSRPNSRQVFTVELLGARDPQTGPTHLPPHLGSSKPKSVESNALPSRGRQARGQELHWGPWAAARVELGIPVA